ATQEFERLKKEEFAGLRLGLLHGGLSSQEKAQVMEKFKAGEFQILISTTVVEVGVDVPNATVIAIEHSERFGLSQLHQLRGRVGRGVHPGTCILGVPDWMPPDAWQRVAVLERTTHGFAIAEADLRPPGPGDFLGTQQAG